MMPVDAQWYVYWSAGGVDAWKRYSTEAIAESAAESLAKDNPGEPVFVMRSVHVYMGEAVVNMRHLGHS